MGSRRTGGGGGGGDPRDRPAHGVQLRGQLNDALVAARAVPRRAGTGVDPNLVFKLHASRRPSDSGFEGRNLELLGETAEYTYFVLTADNGSALALAIDQYATTGDLSSLLDLVDSIELYGPEDRRGPGLDGLVTTGPVQVDVKIWAADNYRQAEARAGLVEQVVRALNGRVDLRAVGVRRTILRITIPVETLADVLNISVVEQIRTPPVPFLDFRDWWSTGIDQLERVEIASQVVGVLDDLPAEHPLLTGLIESVDLIGPADYPWQPPAHHGTEVVGRVLFPRLHEELRDMAPITAHGTVRVARILEPDPNLPGRSRFATWAQPHELVEEGIRLLHNRYGVKIFNLSVGYDEPYNDAHLGALTETIDDLIRELDIVVVVPTGNAGFIGSTARTLSGHHVADDYPHYLDTPEHRLAEPGPAALAVTVGSIALSEAVAEMNPPRLGWQAVAGIDQVSPFSRTGPGTGPNDDRFNKPEFVHYGGNTALNDAGMVVPNEQGSSIVSTALHAESGRLFAACNGTSYAAPPVARVAADIAHAYSDASANLIRVLMAIGSVPPPPALTHEPEPRRRARYGFGMPTSARAISSGRRRATMTYDGSMSIDDVHIHPVPIPQAFRLGTGYSRTMTLTLAFDPPVRQQRREYLAANVQLDLYRQVGLTELQDILRRQDRSAPVDRINDRRRIKLLPGPDSFRSSTLQVRTWKSTRSFVDDDEIFFAVITHTAATWARDDPTYSAQSYAFAVTLEDEHLERADLHQLLTQETRLPAQIRVRG